MKVWRGAGLCSRTEDRDQRPDPALLALGPGMGGPRGWGGGVSVGGTA